MSDVVLSGLIGLVLGVALGSAIFVALTRRQKASHEAEAAKYRGSLVELREERSTDKEINRRLRHELAANTPEGLATTAAEARSARDNAVIDRDHAVEQLEVAKADLEQASNRLADREAKLREYREALQEIRISLESKDNVVASAPKGEPEGTNLAS